MKKNFSLIAIGMMMSVQGALAQSYDLLGGGAPNVPLVNGKANFTNVGTGDLVFDTSDTNLYLRDSSSTWKNLTPTASVITGTTDGLFPSSIANLDNVMATRLGHKVYSHGAGPYNNASAPTITLSTGGGTLTTVYVGDFIPYQMQDGNWRMKFNINVLLSGTSRTGVALAINDVSFFNAQSGQAISGGPGSNTAGFQVLADSSANTVSIVYAMTSTSQHYFSGDVRLASKPNWAY